MKSPFYLIVTSLGLLALSACGGSSGDSGSSDESSSSDGSGGTSGSTSAIDYDFTGSIILSKAKVTSSALPTGVATSVATLSFDDESGSVDTSEATYFESVSGIDVSTSFCVNDDSLSSVSGDSESSDTTSTESSSLSAGVATFATSGTTLATVTPSSASGTVVYDTFALSEPVTTGGALAFDTDYTVSLAGDTNTLSSGASLVIPAFDVDLSIADPEPVNVGSTSLASLVASGQAVSSSTLGTSLNWTPMSLSSPSSNPTNFGYQIVEVVGMDASGAVLGTVQCFVQPDEGDLSAALSQSNGSTVFSPLASATDGIVTISQIHVVESTPGSGTSSSDVGLVTSLALASESFADIVITP